MHAKYAERYLFPQFDAVGENCGTENPWAVRVFGGNITLGCYVQLTAMREKPISFATWNGDGIHVGDYSMINPGVRISSATRVELGRNAILAADVYITDADWHGAYDRIYSTGEHAPVILKPNVWISERAVICKGVTIGENSIIGAASVVTRDVPDNCVAVGNPARVVRELDPDGDYVSRDRVYADPSQLVNLNAAEKELLAGNSLRGWLRYLISPRRGD